MQRLLVAALALCCVCSVTFAKTEYAPIPSSVFEAKTIYLVNRSGKQAVLDIAYKEFEKWGRLKVVEERDSADLIAVFSRAGGGDYDAAEGITRMDIFLKGDYKASDAVYETERDISAGQGILYKHLIPDESAKRCVDDFMKRLAGK